MEEEWRDVVDYEGLYQVSNYGRVKSLLYKGKRRELILKNRPTPDGYFEVCLFKDKQRKFIRVHRIVAIAWIPNPNGLPQVNHKDEVRTNNVVGNLEWCDNKYNINYGTCLQKIHENAHGFNKKKVNQYMKDGTFVRTWNSMTEASLQGFNLGEICACCKGRKKTTGGFIWRYA